MPFGLTDFLETFAVYNRTFWPLVATSWLASLVVVVGARRGAKRMSVALTWLLAAMWLWSAVFYHAMIFTRINPLAWLFCGLFVAEGVALVLAWRLRLLTAFDWRGWRGCSGLALIGYALAYPAVSLASGHAYPALPLFNVPCPTAILTLGVLLSARDRRWWLATVPIIWSAIGGSAAVLFGMTVDYPLLVAGALAGAGFASAGRARRATALCDTARNPA
ncbi:MAG TPA: DUF6064 family protein [Vicinamibacterales bacterium]|nr:DUF6064 family protein [Vicinamibacterales bacterium]